MNARYRIVKFTLFAFAFSLAWPHSNSIRAQDTPSVGEVNAIDGVVSPDASPHSEAQRITELRETIEEDHRQLATLEAEIDSPQGEYALAEKAFSQLKGDLERETQSLEVAKSKADPNLVQSLGLEIASIERQQKLAEARFELAIEDRRTLREQIQTLRGKIKKDQSALDDLTGENEPDEEHREDIDMKIESEASGKASDKGSFESRASEVDQQVKSEEDNSSSDDSASKSDEPEDEAIVEAESEAEELESEANEAQRETQSLADRIADLQKLIAQEQKELSLGRKKIDLAESAQFALTAEITKRQSENADEAEIKELRIDATDASRRLILARSEVNAIVELFF